MSRRLNVRSLTTLVAVTLVAGFAIHWIHDRQVYKSINDYLRRVDVAEAKGDYRGAADNLRIYLTLRPNDLPSMSRYALLLSQDETKATRAELDRAAKLIEVILVRDREHPDLRRRLVRIDRRLGLFLEARTHLNRLLEGAPRDGELHFLMGDTLETLGEYQEAVKSFDHARVDDPSLILAYTRLARLLRTHFREVEKADVLMDARAYLSDGVVSKNPLAAAAYVNRGWYRRDFSMAGAGEDAARALELEPDDLDGRLLAASVALQSKPVADLNSARGHLAHATAHHPKDSRVYQAAAEVELRAKDVNAATARLEEGVKALPDDLLLQWSLIDLKIQVGRLEGLKEMIAGLRKKRVVREVVDYLEAQLLYAQGQWAMAARGLEGAGQLLSLKPELDRLTKRTYVTLGDCYEQLGNLDQRYLAYLRAIKIVPSGGFDDLAVSARTGLAASLIALGRIDQAIEEYRKNLLLPEANEGMKVVLARLLIFRNLRLSEASRRWDEVETLLQSAGQAIPDSSEVVILRSETLGAQRQLDSAWKLLEEARDRHPDEIDFWIALSTLAIRHARDEQALPILDAAEKRLGDRIQIRLARAKYWAGRDGAEASTALTKLEDGAEKFSSQQRFQLFNGIAEARVRLGEIKQAIALWSALAVEDPNNLQIRMLLYDAATSIGNDVDVEVALGEIQRIEGEEGSIWRYGRARQLIGQAVDKKDLVLVQARKLLNDIGVRRPAWPRVPLSIAEIDDRQEHADAALKHYQKAINLGDRSPQAIRRTVQLLYQIRRYEQADQILRQLQHEVPMSSEMQRLAADISLHIHDYSRALDLARRAVTNDSANYRDHIWLGQLLWTVSRKDESDRRKDESKAHLAEAERSLRRGVELAADKPDAWIALIQFLCGVNNVPAAEKAIIDAEKAIPSEESALPLAVAYESVGQTQRAEVLYKEAIEHRPEDATAVQGLANFYVKLNRIEDAKPLLYRLIQLKAKAPDDARWAKRILAVALSMEGKEKFSLKALEMLNLPENQFLDSSNENGNGNDSNNGNGNIEELRAKARVYASQRNRDRRREAIRMFDTINQREGARVEDRVLLAQLFEADGNWAKARDQFLAALVTDPNHVDAMTGYARGLVRRKYSDEARKWIERLTRAVPNSPALAELEARLAVLEGKPDRAVTIMTVFVHNNDAQLFPVAALLEELALFPTSEELYRRNAAQPGQPMNALILAEYLGRRGRTGEALDLCDRAWTTCPAGQVSVSSLRVLFTANFTEADSRRVADRLASAIKAAPDDVSLTFCLANVRILQTRYADAEAIFRSAFDRNKTNPSPLNNLAWLLVMQDGKASEALETINRAIAISGSIPEFLDTRGLIHLAMGRNDLAVKEIEDAVAVAPSPDNQFHLAQAYVAAKRLRDASEALQEARTLGLKPETLHPIERRAYNQLVLALPKK